MEGFKRHLATGLQNFINTFPESLAFIHKKAIMLHKAVMEEIGITGREAGFQNVIEDDIVELLQSVSLPLANEELAELKHIKKHRLTILMRMWFQKKIP
jgi:hypothetical protein